MYAYMHVCTLWIYPCIHVHIQKCACKYTSTCAQTYATCNASAATDPGLTNFGNMFCWRTCSVCIHVYMVCVCVCVCTRIMYTHGTDI